MRLSAATAIGLFLLSGAAHAETLPISGVYPAGSDEAAPLQSVAVENFGGTDGPTLSLRIEDLLRDVYIYRKPWFAVVPASGGANADAILRGTATADVRRDDIKLTRKRCMKRDEDKKCTEYKEVEAECIRRTVVLNYSIRLVRWQGDLVWRDDGAPQQQIDYCPRDDDSVKTVETTVTELLAPVASNTRYALAPYESRRDIRVMETRKGLKGEPDKAFKAAVALTKSDIDGACANWDGIGATITDHPSVEVNRGLCAEMRDEFDAAEALYRHALQLSPKADYASDGLRRIRDRRRAEAQLATHWGE